jgi:hypothetical protein
VECIGVTVMVTQAQVSSAPTMCCATAKGAVFTGGHYIHAKVLPHEITVLRRPDDEDALLGLEGRMRDEARTRAANLVMCGRPDGEAAAREGLEEPVVAGGEPAPVDPLCAAIEAAVDTGTGAGDLAALAPTNALVAEYAGRISGLGLTTQKLERYDGTPNNHVKVGTYQRAKGLEFKQVFLPPLDADGVGEKRRRGAASIGDNNARVR